MAKNEPYRESTYYFALPSFWTGIARLFDFGGTFTRYNDGDPPEVADAIALWNDWHAVGRDLLNASEFVHERRRTESGRETS